MNILVTGAGGFLGRPVVAGFLRQGHRVRALVRPVADAGAGTWPSSVEVYRADLRGGDLGRAFEGIDALVHLAACVTGDDAAHFSSTVGGTERLLQAMGRSGTRRLVLASTFSVYDWRAARGTLDESSPLEGRIHERGAYAVAKLWQERIVRRASEAHGWDLTVLRPGIVWGAGNDGLALVGLRAGSWHLVLGPLRRLPLTYVENCADCVVRATLDPRAFGQTFNVLDDEAVTAWDFLGEHLRRGGARCTRIPVPFVLARLAAHAATALSGMLFRGGGKLPSLLMPARLAVYRPLRFSNRRLHEVLGWNQPVRLAEALKRSFGR